MKRSRLSSAERRVSCHRSSTLTPHERAINRQSFDTLHAGHGVDNLRMSVPGYLRLVRRRMLPLSLFAMLSVLFAGCTSPDIYSWGRYEDLLYTSYSKPEKAPAEVQLERMEAPLARLGELTGADAVLFLRLNQYGSRYQLDNFSTTISVVGKLVDVRSGLTLWEGSGSAYEDSATEPEYDSDKSILENILAGIFSDIFSAAVDSAVSGLSDNTHALCDDANKELFFNPGYGLLYGPYHPHYGAEPRNSRFE